MELKDPITYRCPRTLEQAYGPGTRGLTKPARRPIFERQDMPVLVTVAIGALSLGAAFLMGWRP